MRENLMSGSMRGGLARNRRLRRGDNGHLRETNGSSAPAYRRPPDQPPTLLCSTTS
jgi:hypothetical protein